MAIRHIELAALVLLALINDIKSHKIKNLIVFPFMIAGLITNYFESGLNGLIDSLIGTFVPLAALMILYVLRMLGAGDIKLLGAIGAVMGLEFVVFAAFYSFLAGGAIAVLLMIYRKNGLQRFKHLWNYIKTCFLTFSLHPYDDSGNPVDHNPVERNPVECNSVECDPVERNPAVDNPTGKKGDGSRFPFACAIAAGSILKLLEELLLN